PAWARALLPHRLVTGRAELLDVLEAGQQADVVSALLRDVPANSVGAAHGNAVLRDCPGPWNPQLATAALADTSTRAWPAAASHSLRERLDLLARRLPPDRAADVAEFARHSDLTDSGRVSAAQALDILLLRARFHAELATPEGNP
ncbi:MAG: hypothetical protein ACRYF3_13700, partial [Janthinobacterium lividum]